jgi:ribosomal-protein-alanine N-acetyltransferase
LARLVRDPHGLAPVSRTLPNGAVTRAAYRNRLRRQLRESRDGTGYAFFIFRAADDALLGGVTLSNVQRGVAMSCSLGYWVGEQHTRQGVMSEAITSLLPFVFGTLGLHRLEAACLPSNVASQRLLRKLGFHEEGYARAYLRINGQWHDHLLFAMLANDRDEKKA